MNEKAMVAVVEKLEEEFDLSDALGHVIRYALHHGCHMVNFDRDADRIDGLGYFGDSYEVETE